MAFSSSGGAPSVRGRLTSLALTASMLASFMTFTVATPTFASPHSASDFFAFARAEFGLARNGNEQDCDTSNDKQVDVSGSGNDIFGRLHSNADIAATSGGTTTFHGAITYGTTEIGDCVEQSEDATNTYLAGQPQDLDADPPGVVAGWPGDLASYLNADGLNFGNDITQILTGIDPETGLAYVCDIGSLTNVGTIEIDETDDDPGNEGLVVCNGEGQLTKLSTQNQEVSITIVSHGPIEISGQGATLRPEAHNILTWTDWPLDVSTKLAGSNLSVPRTAILFAPSGGIDTSGSEDADLCIQLIGQGPIKVPGSSSDFGPGSEACTENVPTPDVFVLKDPDAGTINAGATAIFSITVTNSGPGASNVTLSDTLPTAVVWAEAVGGDPSNACEVSVGSPQVLTCDFGSVPDTAGLNTRTVSISAPTDSSDCGPLDNTVTITASGDINLTNNSDNGSITVACPNVSVAKTPDGENVTAGETATFSILVTNNGPGAASNVMLSDTLPNGGLVWTEVPGSDSHDKCTVSPPPAPQTLACDFGTISDQAGQNTRTVSVSSPVDTGDCGPNNNTVTISATGDINPVDNTDTGLITVLCPIIRVEKTPDEDAQNPSANDISAGENATFVITVHNDGDGVANGVTVFDDLPGLGWSVVGADTTLVGCAVTDPDVGEHALKGEILTCGPDTLGVGANKKVTVTRPTTAADCGQLNNSATAAATNNGNDTDPGAITVLCPDLVVEKTPDGEVINAGEEISFTIKVTNNGPGTAFDVVIDDELPAGFAWAEDPDLTECAITAGDLHCDVGDLASGEDFSVTVSAPTDEEDCRDTAYFNTAVADASNHAAVNNTGDVLIECPDLVVEKTPDGEVINAGEEISFTIKVTNNGPGTAFDVVIDDELPAGFAWAEDPDLTECAITAGDLHCDVGDLASGEDFSVTVSAPTDEEDCRDTAYFNTAVADASNHAAVNNTGDVLIECPDLVVEKTPDGEVINAGEEISFTIKVTNNGPGTAFDVVIDDELPAGFAWAEDPDLTECAITAGDLHCDVGDLASGEDFSVTVSAPTDEEDCRDTAYFNTAVADASNHAAVNNTGDVLIECPDLVVEKTPDGEVINAGEEISFTIKVTNNGPGTAFDVVIDDELPAGFAWAEDPDLTECAITAGDLHCDVGDLASGEDFSVTVSAPTDEEDCRDTAYFNTAVADASNHAAVNNTGDVLIECPDVTIDKEPVDTPISAGEQGQFTIEVTNNGPGDATDVVVIDHPEAGTVWTVLDDGGFTCESVEGGGSQVLTCTLELLEAEDSATILIGYTTTPDDCPSVDNAVTVTASNEPLANTENNSDEATIVVECPGLNLLKEADADPIDAGEEASFTITIWNTGPGDAFDVTLHDDLPAGLQWSFEIVSGDAVAGDCSVASSQVPGEDSQMSIDCDFGTLAPTTMAGGIVIRVFATTDRTDCGLLENTAEADGSNLDEPLTASDSILVRCPTIGLEKENDSVGSVLPGTEVTYTLTLTVDDGPAEDVVVVDTLPVGLENPTDISDSGLFAAATRTITWNLGDLADGEYELTYQAVVADDVDNGEELINAATATSPNSQCPDLATLGPECRDTSIVIPRVPTLVIDKVANAEVITISGPANAQIATPSVVTWTLSYTLTNGPVTNAVITDVVPAGFTFLDAANGGTLVGGTTVTWNLGTLTASGSVTFRTTVNVATISRTAPTVNTAVIDSNETAPDQGQDSVRVVVEPPPLGGTPTPTPALPNTALGTGIGGEPVNVPVELLVVMFLGSLGALAFANVRARR